MNYRADFFDRRYFNKNHELWTDFKHWINYSRYCRRMSRINADFHKRALTGSFGCIHGMCKQMPYEHSFMANVWRGYGK